MICDSNFYPHPTLLFFIPLLSLSSVTRLKEGEIVKAKTQTETLQKEKAQLEKDKGQLELTMHALHLTNSTLVYCLLCSSFLIHLDDSLSRDS